MTPLRLWLNYCSNLAYRACVCAPTTKPSETGKKPSCFSLTHVAGSVHAVRGEEPSAEALRQRGILDFEGELRSMTGRDLCLACFLGQHCVTQDFLPCVLALRRPTGCCHIKYQKRCCPEIQTSRPRAMGGGQRSEYSREPRPEFGRVSSQFDQFNLS